MTKKKEKIAANYNMKLEVMHHNDITESVFDLKLKEFDIFITLISKLKGKSMNATFTAKEIRELVGDDKKGYSNFEKLIKELNTKYIRVQDKNNPESRIEVLLFYSLKFDDKNHSVDVVIHPELKSKIFNLKTNFTKYDLHEFISLNTINGKRIFQLLKQWQANKKWEVEIDKLKELLGLEGNYERFRDFKIYVLNSAIESINKETSLNVSYKVVRKGRSAHKLVFEIGSKIEVPSKIYTIVKKNFTEFPLVLDVLNKEYNLARVIQIYGIDDINNDFKKFKKYLEKLDSIESFKKPDKVNIEWCVNGIEKARKTIKLEKKTKKPKAKRLTANEYMELQGKESKKLDDGELNRYKGEAIKFMKTKIFDEDKISENIEIIDSLPNKKTIDMIIIGMTGSELKF